MPTFFKELAGNRLLLLFSYNNFDLKNCFVDLAGLDYNKQIRIHQRVRWNLI